MTHGTPNEMAIGILHASGRTIDLLIFAAAGQDLIESATAHVVQQNFGTNATVFDLNNACCGVESRSVYWPLAHRVRRRGFHALASRDCGAQAGDTRHTGQRAEPDVHYAHRQSRACRALMPESRGGVYDVADFGVPTVDSLLRTMFERRGEPDRSRYVDERVAWGVAVLCETARRTLRRSGEPTLTRFAVAGVAQACELDLSRAREPLGYCPRWTFRDGPL